jgi:hypothetical protein
MQPCASQKDIMRDKFDMSTNIEDVASGVQCMRKLFVKKMLSKKCKHIQFAEKNPTNESHLTSTVVNNQIRDDDD